MGEDQLLDLTLSTTKINHSLHSTAVQMIKNVHFCAKIFTSKVQFRLLLHTQVTKNLKNELNYHAPLTRYSEFSIISTSLINTGAVEQGGHLPTQFLENKIEIL